MPRKSRIDAPGALHHIIARGIEGTDIFTDDNDRHLKRALAGDGSQFIMLLGY